MHRLLIILFGLSSITHAADFYADVIVYGSTPGGYCAAIAAAREGASVILLEPTAHIGGMNTGGLSFSDSNQMYRDKLMGLFHEWHLRIQQDYQSRGVTLPYDVNVKDQKEWSYEASVASRITNAMLSEAKVTVLTERYLQSVNKTGPRITSIVTSNGTYSGRVFIDGSYEGDLMAAAAVSWTIGREGKADFNESRAGKVYPKLTMNINGRDGGGNPLPLITTTDAGPVDAGDDNLMAYSFRLAITKKAANRVPYPAPANYDPARFEVMRRYIQAGGDVNMVGYDQYTVPNNKADGNNSIAKQFSLGLIGAAKNWHTANQAGRAAIFEAHRQYTLEFLYFLANDSVFTTQQRAAAAEWGLCADEFTNNGNFPPQLYVRESRRMRGQYVISQNDIITNPAKQDPIMISSFPIDSHDCQRVVLPDGKVRNEGTIFPVKPSSNNERGYAYHVPYRSILPQSAECDNLLVPVALSCTHVAMCSLRIEATWMLIGQSAGIAAALAANQDLAVQALPYATLQPRLTAQGQVLTLPGELGGIVLDDPNAVLAGTWVSSTTVAPFYGKGYRFAGANGVLNNGSATATFRFTATVAGTYKLKMAYSPDPSRATNVPVTVTSGPHVTNLTVNQTVARPADSLVREIGTVQLVAGQESVITIGSAGTKGFVILDALQLVLETPTGTNFHTESFSSPYIGASNGTGPLTGTTPTETTSGVVWSASDWRENGTAPTSASSADDDSAFLPFQPVVGNRYTLSATLSQPTGGGSTGWVAIGFTKTNTTTGSFWANEASPWMLWRPGNGSPASEVVSWIGPSTTGSVNEGPATGIATLAIVLNTVNTAWTAEWFVNGASVRAETFGTNPTINHVGLGREDGQSATFSNFSLTVANEGGTFSLTIAPNPQNPGHYDFQWNSRTGKVYDLVSSTDLSAAIATWTVWNGQSGIPATAPTNTLTNIPGNGASKRFFAVIER